MPAAVVVIVVICMHVVSKKSVTGLAAEKTAAMLGPRALPSVSFFFPQTQHQHQHQHQLLDHGGSRLTTRASRCTGACTRTCTAARLSTLAAMTMIPLGVVPNTHRPRDPCIHLDP